jgi:hypothetical protein
VRALLVAVALLAFPAAAGAQAFSAPTLTPDLAFAPPTGIARGDFIAGTITDIAAAVAVDGDRIYTVGRTQGGTGGSDIGIIARRADGALDTGFSDDGKLIIALAPSTESDIGTSIAVLPDHRLRVVAATDVVPGSSESLDIAIVGLNPDGSPDLQFGGGTGKVIFPAGPSSDVPARIVAGPDGRLAVVGSRSNGSRDDLFVSLREADGSPVSGFGTNGVKFVDRGGTVGGVSMVDRGVDVEFRPGGGLLALVLVETNPSSAFDYVAALHAFDAAGNDDPSFSGDGDLVLGVGEPDTVPGGLLAYGGRYYVTGYTRAGADTNAFLARVEADGSGLDSRQFDMRGRVVGAGQPVVSRALDLAVVPGLPPTLVTAGSVDWVSDTGSTATDWAAAAFNGFEGPLASAGFGDVVLQAAGQGGLLSVAAGAGWAAVAGTLIDASTADNSYGGARLLIDADKRCDLAVSVAAPAEIVFRGAAPAGLTATVTNHGTRACAGTLRAAAPYALDAWDTGPLAPNASVTATALPVRYSGARRAEDFMKVSVAAAGDSDTTNNDALVHLVFRYCDVRLHALGASGLIPDEGTRAFAVTLSNAGTSACRVRLGRAAPYSLERGKSVEDRIRAAAPRGARPGKRAAVVLRASAGDDVEPQDNSVAVSPVVVGVGDTRIARWGARSISGTAARGRGAGLKAAQLRVRRVEVAVMRRAGKRCRWLTASGGFATRSCTTPRWLRARGTTRWRLTLRRALPGGRYTIRSRATIGAGFPEASFSTRDRNQVTARIS